MHRGLIVGLRARNVDILTPVDAELLGQEDAVQLTFATQKRRVLYSCNVRDFCRLHGEWISQGKQHAGIIVMPRQRYSVGEQLKRLLRLNGSKPAEDFRGRLEFL